MQTKYTEEHKRNPEGAHRKVPVPNLEDLKNLTEEELQELEQNLCSVTGRTYIPVPSLPEGVSWFAAVMAKLHDDLKEAKSPYHQARILNDCHAGLFRVIDHTRGKFREVLGLKKPYPRPKNLNHQLAKRLDRSGFWATMDYLWQLKNLERSIDYHSLLDMEPKKGSRDAEKGQLWWILVGNIDFEEMRHKLNPEKVCTANWCRQKIQKALLVGAIEEAGVARMKKYYKLGHWQWYRDRKTGEWHPRAVPLKWW